jgi:hypothetical protein
MMGSHCDSVERSMKRNEKQNDLWFPAQPGKPQKTHEANPIKLFTVKFTNFLNKLECFFLVKPFQPSLMFKGEARSLP